ncbi:GNAT family N-acetyltransferase [Kribbella italica]|uniref:RimJ/RimL family protein N-acetyltransferase n=1 Tax=Kribbella italica TaxID=1540520 RepID=A0A7W9MXR4_9ACTN|nr:GNAT family N-acetyltransferase [Kribbella italica]MBB5839358.1 RimJ/RimL family protein N-acetyltransferase [Kribbella italica]
MREVDCVGALIRDSSQRVYVHRRTASRRLFPGIWDVVGGHVEAGETPEEALAREVFEETGWTVRDVLAVVADWEWTYEGRVRRELDYLVTVDGDLSNPRLEEGKHDAGAWVGADDVELLMVGRTDGDRRLLEIVAHAVRIRLTDRLRLVPIGGPVEVLGGHGPDLERLHADPWVAEWYAETLSAEAAVERAAAVHAAWERDGVNKWMAYERAGAELAEGGALVGRGTPAEGGAPVGRGALVGRGGLSRLAADSVVTEQIAALVGLEWAADRLELGWALVESARGRGYATEIGAAGLEFAFGTLGAQAVIAFTEQHNRASRAVMERMGMQYAGEIVAEGLVEGVDSVRPDAPFAVHLTARADQKRT